jgi:hypothetical protein
MAVGDLDAGTAAELGILLRDTTRVVEAICQPEQTYVSLWSHAAASPGTARKHLHFVVQPVTAALVVQYGGLRSEQLQARIMASGEGPAVAEVERFCDQARALFLVIRPGR